MQYQNLGENAAATKDFQDVVATHLEILEAVVAGQQQARDPDRAAAGRPTVEDHARVERGERAVPTHARFELEDRLWRRRRGQEFFGPRHHDGDRTSQPDGQRRRERLEQHELSTEASADRHRDDADPVLRHAERGGDFRTREEQGLHAGPYGDVSERIHAGDCRPRLEISLMHHRRLITTLDHDVGVTQARRDVASREALGARDVRRRRLGDLLTPDGGAVHGELFFVGVFPGLDDRRIRSHRLDRVHHRGQHVVVDFDELRGVLGDRFGLRDHRHHGMPVEARFVDRERSARSLTTVGTV